MHHYKLWNCCLSWTPSCKLGSSGSVWLGFCAASGDNLRGRRLGFAWSLAARLFWRLQPSRKQRLLIELPHLAEGGENVGWRGGKVWANVVVRTSQPVLDSWRAAQRVTDSEQNHPGAGMKHASAWLWHSSSRGYWCMYGITHELIHFSHHVQEFFRVMMTAVLTWQLSCSAWTNGKQSQRSNTLARMFDIAKHSAATMGLWRELREAAVCVVCARRAGWTWAVVTFWAMAAAIASGLIRQKRQAREQHLDRPSTNRRRKSPNKNKGLCNGNLVDIFSKVRIFGLRKRRLRRQGLGTSLCGVYLAVTRYTFDVDCAYIYWTAYGPN